VTSSGCLGSKTQLLAVIRADTHALAGGAPRPKMARPSTTSEANVAVAWPHDVELQIEDEAD
jgi:hypothetical protein